MSASRKDDKIAWYENLNSGIFGSQQIITTDADKAEFVMASDLDDDGFEDVLSASSGDNKIAWYKNLGDGTFGKQEIISLEASGAKFLFVSDLDGDADQDVLSASYGDDKIAWYENLGSGSFGPQNILTAECNYGSVYASDLDGDGDMDVLAPSAGDLNLVWFENSGSGLFGDPRIVVPDVERTYLVYSSDLDGDGDMDVFTSAEGNSILRYENRSVFKASFTSASTGWYAPSIIRFSVIPNGYPTSWLWDFGDGGTSTEQNPTHTYEAEGTYTVSLTVSNGDDTDTETKTDFITVRYRAPEADFTSDILSGIRPLEVQFNDQSENHISSWLWDFGDGNTSNEQNPSHTYTLGGQYTVKLVVTGNGGVDSLTIENYIYVKYPLGTSTKIAANNKIEIFPNPTDFECLIRLSLEKPGNTSILIWNTMGQLEAVLYEGYLPADKHQMHFSFSDFEPGFYFISLKTKSNHFFQKLLIAR